MANILDKAIEAFSPGMAYRRAVARSALSVMNNGTGYGNYGASRISRAMRSWHVGGGSAKEDIEDNIETLRKRSRDAYMGIPLATGAIKTLRTNVVGSGLVPTPQVDADYLHLTEEQADQLQAQISREFELWADSALCKSYDRQHEGKAAEAEPGLSGQGEEERPGFWCKRHHQPTACKPGAGGRGGKIFHELHPQSQRRKVRRKEP